jgi:hypothetical protein
VVLTGFVSDRKLAFPTAKKMMLSDHQRKPAGECGSLAMVLY